MVLHLLANRGPITCPDIERQYLGLTAEQARRTIETLARRGFVDVAAGGDFVRGRYVRAFALTRDGHALEATLLDALAL